MKLIFFKLLLLSAFVLLVSAKPTHHKKKGSGHHRAHHKPSSPAPAGGKAVIGYFPNWLGDSYPVSKIQFSKYTHIQYAFAIMINGSTPTWTDPDTTKTQLPSLVSAAKKTKTKVLISAGGWTGSITFSSMASTAASRKEFIQWNIAQIKKYKTDGVDIDWEYPGRQGAGCNEVDEKNDLSNFVTLLKELRAALDSAFGKNAKELSIAGDVNAFSATDNSLIKQIGDAVTRVNIMMYDINGAWNAQTGPNSPLKGGSINFTTAVNAWTSAGVPANKLTAGLPFYGRSTTAKEDMTKTKSINQDQSSVIPKGDSLDTPFQDPYCAKDPGGLSGIWTFGNLLAEGVLATPLTAKAPWVRFWDEGSETPWLFNPKTKIFISYDDPKSIGLKVAEAKTMGLAGVMIWSVEKDSDKNDLLNAVVKA